MDENQELRDDINQLKERVNKALETLQAMEKRRDTYENLAAASKEPQAIPSIPLGFTTMHPHFVNQGAMPPITVYPCNPANFNGTHMQFVSPYNIPLGDTPSQTTSHVDNNPLASTYIPPNLTQTQGQDPATNGTPPPQISPHILLPYVLPPSYILLPNINAQKAIPSRALHFNPQPHPTPAIIPHLQSKEPQSEEKLQILEERLRAIEGGDRYGLNAVDLCLVPNMVIPPKFNVPEFHNYQGTTCPKNHLTRYCRKMAHCAHDDKLLIHFFQESLTGAALSWYLCLERSQIRSWKDLADAFVKQYMYNIGMTPGRMQLQSMMKMDEESFKEYAQRWRELVAQVEPPLLDKEMVIMFIDTLQSPFYDMMIGNVSSDFSDLVVIGERVEKGMMIGKIVINSDETNGSETHVIIPSQEGYS